MKLKSLLAFATLAASTAAMANSVQSDGTLCRIEVDSTAASTIIAVPLAKVGDGTPIPANQLVLTDNLAENDKIFHKNGNTWDAWVIELDSSGNKYWKPTYVSGDSTVSQTPPSATTTFDPGDAIWVERSAPTDSEGKAVPFYVYGQVTNDTSITRTIARGTSSENPVYTMLGNTVLADKAISNLTFITGTPVTGDCILWGKIFRQYNGTEWGYYTNVTHTLENGFRYKSTDWVKANGDTIPAGQGVWYMSVGGTGEFEVKWN